MPDTHHPLVSHGSVTQTPRKATMRIPSIREIIAHSKRPQLLSTPLTSTEANNANDVWENYVKSSYLTSLGDLEQLVNSLQVPLQPISRKLCDEEFRASKGRFSYRDFVVLLERLKTLHTKWLHKLRGKELDDDLLEAFVAVGGQSDSHGEVDLAKMREVVSEFHLNVDLDKIVADMDNDGDANIDFSEFASLIRDEHNKQKKKRPANDDDDDNDGFSLDGLDEHVGGSPGAAQGPPPPITLSSMMYVDEEQDQALLFPPMGLTSRKDPGELSCRAKSIFKGGHAIDTSVLTARKNKMLGDSSFGPVTPTGHHNQNAPASSSAVALGNQQGVRKPQGKLSPIHSPARTQIAPAGHGALGSGGATAYYKGGGGLRNLTPAPTVTHKASEGPEEPRSSSVMSQKTRAKLLPPQAKKHKFAN